MSTTEMSPANGVAIPAISAGNVATAGANLQAYACVSPPRSQPGLLLFFFFLVIATFRVLTLAFVVLACALQSEADLRKGIKPKLAKRLTCAECGDHKHTIDVSFACS